MNMNMNMMLSRYLTQISSLTLLIVLFCANGADAQQRKRAQTTMKFLSTSNYANASAMANAVTAMEGGAWHQFYNPSAMAWSPQKVDLTGSVNEWIAGINYSSLAATIQPLEGRFGIIGFNMVNVDYGELQRTIRADNERGYIDVGTFSPTAFSAGLSYAKNLSNQFAVGANVKFVTQDLGAGIVGIDNENGLIEQSFSASTTIVDFGVFYRTGLESLNFAMSVTNFSRDVSYDSRDHELPLTFKMGLSMDIIDLTDLSQERHALIVNVDANRPRDYNEQIQVGAEYGFNDLFFLRGGYVFPSDEEGYSVGFGVKGSLRNNQMLLVDYSYSDFGIFSNDNRLTFRIAI